MSWSAGFCKLHNLDHLLYICAYLTNHQTFNLSFIPTSRLLRFLPLLSHLQNKQIAFIILQKLYYLAIIILQYLFFHAASVEKQCALQSAGQDTRNIC